MLITVINKRGTTRNIEDTQLHEYEAKGYKKVEVKQEVAPAKNTNKKEDK